MIKTEILNPALETIGEEIGHELGAKMVKDFQDQYPNDLESFIIGRNIIEKVLAQPNCSGIRLYNGLNELGEKTLVIVGIDNNERVISEYSTINSNGILEKYKGIVADRITTKNAPSTAVSTTVETGGWWF